MTIDKFITIKLPHKAASYSTPKRAKWITVIIFVCVITYNLPDLFFTQLIGKDCISYAVGGVYAKIYSWLTLIVNGIIPLTLLIFMNITIVHEVRKSHKQFGSHNSVNNIKDQMRQRVRNSIDNQLTIMLLLVTTLFVLLMVPTYVRFLYFTYVSRDTPEKYATARLFYYLSSRLYFTNSGINFFLYCISGKKFREDLKDLLLFRRCCVSKGKIERTFTASTIQSDSF